jgi:chromate transporter
MGGPACLALLAPTALAVGLLALAAGGRGAGPGRAGDGVRGLAAARPEPAEAAGRHADAALAAPGPARLGAAELGALFLHFTMLSLLAIGGAITTVPDMQRWVVGERGWLSDAQFTASVALAQAAPGPNVLFVAVIGWNVAGLAGVAATLARQHAAFGDAGAVRHALGQRARDSLGVRAFTAGLAPLTMGLLLATGWVLTEPTRGRRWPPCWWLGTMCFMLRTRGSPLWPVAAGALLGAAGYGCEMLRAMLFGTWPRSLAACMRCCWRCLWCGQERLLFQPERLPAEPPPRHRRRTSRSAASTCPARRLLGLAPAPARARRRRLLPARQRRQAWPAGLPTPTSTAAPTSTSS